MFEPGSLWPVVLCLVFAVGFLGVSVSLGMFVWSVENASGQGVGAARSPKDEDSAP
jgi:hypothetical protein